MKPEAAHVIAQFGKRCFSAGAWLLTCAAGVPVEAWCTLAAGVPSKVKMAPALTSWAAGIIY